MIKLEHITKTFELNGKKIQAVKDVSLEIQSGEIFGIIGFSGAGKSTLVRCINLLEQPDSGKVLIAEEDITGYTGQALRKIRQKIGMIFQHFNLMPSRTVFENIDDDKAVVNNILLSISSKVPNRIIAIPISALKHKDPTNNFNMIFFI